jgi:hypothetical protein
MLSHYFYQELLRCSLVASFCNKAFRNFPFVINGAPKVKSLTVYFDEDFIQVSLPDRVAPQPFLSDFLSKFCTKPIYSKSHSFVANINSTSMQDIFNLAET